MFGKVGGIVTGGVVAGTTVGITVVLAAIRDVVTRRSARAEGTSGSRWVGGLGEVRRTTGVMGGELVGGTLDGGRGALLEFEMEST